MPFDTERFASEIGLYEARTEDVPVNGLRAWFAEGEALVWRVRGLTTNEITRANEAVSKNRDMTKIMAKLAGPEKADAVQELLGLDGKAPDEAVRRLNYLVLGSIEPTVDHPLAVRLADAFPVEFTVLTNKIIELTGLGKVPPGKSKPSGSDQMSALPSPSEISSDAVSTS